MIARREFCFGALAFLAAALTGCKQHVPVLKVPEDADECVDLLRFFTDPAFGFEQARAGLGLTGEPRLMDDPKSRKLYTFDDQAGIVNSIDLETGADSRPDANKLTGIYIHFRTPIEISLRRVESYLGASRQYHAKVAAEPSSPVAAFTNLRPGQKERQLTSYGFSPAEPIAPGHLKGDFLFICEATSWDTKSVDVLRYQRFVSA